jgi:hypothetical protein
MNVVAETERCGPVLDKMIEILATDDDATIASALEQAKRELAIDIPREVEARFKFIVFRMIASVE